MWDMTFVSWKVEVRWKIVSRIDIQQFTLDKRAEAIASVPKKQTTKQTNKQTPWFLFANELHRLTTAAT
jgi:hypothetical protein